MPPRWCAGRADGLPIPRRDALQRRPTSPDINVSLHVHCLCVTGSNRNNHGASGRHRSAEPHGRVGMDVRILIKGGSVVDGVGAPAYTAGVGVAAGRILGAFIGRETTGHRGGVSA